MLQLFLLLLLLLVAGIVASVAGLTDPNSTPNPSRKLLLPIGLSILLGIGGAVALAWAAVELVDVSGGSDGFVGFATVLAVFVLGGGGVSGFVPGSRYNRRSPS
jgi:hypothetical protein